MKGHWRDVCQTKLRRLKSFKTVLKDRSSGTKDEAAAAIQRWLPLRALILTLNSFSDPNPLGPGQLEQTRNGMCEGSQKQQQTPWSESASEL
jgi:hypothetical protein